MLRPRTATTFGVIGFVATGVLASPHSGAAERLEAITIEPLAATRDIAYGSTPRQVFDFFPAANASAENPRPVVLYFHGGGFRKGDKSNVSERLIEQLHAAGISVASVNYRFFTTNPLPAPMHDGARVVQFLRRHADRFGIDKDRVAATGSSAGAGICLWIAFHDDLAVESSPDPVERESSRITTVWVKDAQVAYHPEFWRGLGLHRITDARLMQELVGSSDEPITPEAEAAIRESSPITHLTPDDPSIRADYRAGITITTETPMSDLLHHPAHGIALRDAAREVGVTVELHHGDSEKPGESGTEYLIRLLDGSEATP